MKSQIIRKQAGLNASETNTVLQYFEVQPDDKNLERYICNVEYVVEQIDGKKESFYVNRGGKEISVFVNHKPNGEKFIQTEKDETQKDNLWSLPDFEFSKDEYVRKGTPNPVNPYTLKKLIPYLLSALILGLLLPILYCWFSGGCGCKPCPPCPTRKIVYNEKVIYFKFDETNFDNLPGENYEKTLEKCLSLYKEDTTNFFVEFRGYADIKGSSDYNEILAGERVLKVANYFKDNGVDSSQITIQQEFGNTYAKNTTDPKIQALDRKVGIRIYGLEKK